MIFEVSFFEIFEEEKSLFCHIWVFGVHSEEAI